jgi:hypothetical protein
LGGQRDLTGQDGSVNKTGLLFIAGLWLVGILSGVVVARMPGSLPLPSPNLMVPLIVALLVEVAIRPAIASGRIEPLTMAARVIAVFGAALVSLGMVALLSAA